MPYKLNANCVVKADTGVKCHDTHAQAVAHLRALEANVTDAKSMTAKMLDDMGNPVGMTGTDYARQEAWDISAAASVLSQIASMCINEVDEPDDIKTLANIARSLMEFISGELDEMQKAARRGDAYAKSAPAQVRESPLKLDYVKSLGVKFPSMAVKFVALDQIKGYNFLWGSPNLTDVEVEYFTKDSNFWDEILGKSARPLTWDHAQDEDFKAAPVIGQITDFGDDEVGRWYVAKLDRAHRYRKAIDALIEEGKLGTSSDSAPQYVQRVKTGKATWLKEWPWFASALTDTPAEPRMIGSLEVLKSLGVQLPDTRAAWEWDKQRLQILKLKQGI
jgi:hypothetical protein